MTEKTTDCSSVDAHPGKKHTDTRSSRTIRFSDREWEQVTEAAARHDVSSPAEFVRNAALTMSEDQSLMTRGALSPALAQMIEHTFRGVLFLSTLKRDELVRQGRQDEVDNLIREGRDVQSELLEQDSSHEPAQNLNPPRIRGDSHPA